MKRLGTAALLVALLLSGCAASEQREERADALQQKYAALAGWSATVETALPREGELLRYVLRLTRSGDETRAEVLEPESIAGITATLRGDDLTVGYDGMVLDAGSADERLTVLNAADLTLRAAASGYITERSEERFEDTDALRLCFESGAAGEPLLCIVFFDGDDCPLYAEWERDGEILLYLRFTDFSFDAILTTEEQ